MAKRNRLRFHEWNGAKVIDLGQMEIWDGADLALLRETLTRVIEREHCRSVGINLAYVKYIPSGFFGLLYDWRERGVRILLFNPQLHVQRMLWFQQFLEPIARGCYLLLDEPKQPYEAGRTPRWATTRPEIEDDIDEDHVYQIPDFDRVEEDDEFVFAHACDDEEFED